MTALLWLKAAPQTSSSWISSATGTAIRQRVGRCRYRQCDPKSHPVRKPNVLSGNAGDWPLSAGTNPDDSEWIVLEVDDWFDFGQHTIDGQCDTSGENGGGSDPFWAAHTPAPVITTMPQLKTMDRVILSAAKRLDALILLP